MSGWLDQALDRVQSNRTIQYMLLAGVTLLALTLRLYKLGEWSFWIDEIFTIYASQFVWDWQPARLPLNLLLIHYAINWFGVGEWSARIVPALIGTISVPILFFPIKRLFGPITAVITVILLAIAPWHLFWSQNARFYVLLMLFYNLGLFYTLIALQEKKWLFFVIGGFFLLLALREKFTAIFFVPVLAFYAFTLLILPHEKPKWLNWKTLFFIASPAILYVLYDTYSYFSQGHSQILGILGIFVGQPIEDPLRLGTSIFFQIGPPVIALAFFSGIYLLSQKNQAALFLLSGAIIPIVALLIINPFVFTKSRYIFTALPFWLVLAAIGIKNLLSSTNELGKFLAIGVLAMLLTDAFGSHLLYYHINNGDRRDWRQAFSLVEENSHPEDIVITYWPELGGYYLDREMISWADADSEMIVQSGKRIWFVLDSETVWGDVPLKLWVEQNAELIDILYLRLREDDFSLHIYLYHPEEQAME